MMNSRYIKEELEICIKNIETVIQALELMIENASGIDYPSDYDSFFWGDGVHRCNINCYSKDGSLGLSDKIETFKGIKSAIEKYIDDMEEAEQENIFLIASLTKQDYREHIDLMNLKRNRGESTNQATIDSASNEFRETSTSTNQATIGSGSNINNEFQNTESNSNQTNIDDADINKNEMENIETDTEQSVIEDGNEINNELNDIDTGVEQPIIEDGEGTTDKYFETPDRVICSESEIKFYDDLTGEELITTKRIGGQDVFYLGETEEIITDLGAGETQWANDIDYLEEMRQLARETGSETGWFCAVDRDNFKTTVLAYVDGDWRVVKTFDCGTGIQTTEGLEGAEQIAESTTETGVFVVEQKTEHDGPDDWYTCFYKEDEADVGQGFHEGFSGVSEYQTDGSTALSTENAQWIYNNIPEGSTVAVF